MMNLNGNFVMEDPAFLLRGVCCRDVCLNGFGRMDQHHYHPEGMAETCFHLTSAFNVKVR